MILFALFEGPLALVESPVWETVVSLHPVHSNVVIEGDISSEPFPLYICGRKQSLLYELLRHPVVVQLIHSPRGSLNSAVPFVRGDFRVVSNKFFTVGF